MASSLWSEMIKPYYQDEWVQIYHGDCREILPSLSEASAIVTDPPYELGFMGKSWDSKGISFQPETWKVIRQSCLSGSPLLSFGGSRTSHRIACAIEDAGWEIRDTLMWVYGSGFPKSLNVSKAIEGVLGKQGKGFITAGDDDRKAEFKQDKSFRSDYGYEWQPATAKAQLWEGYGTGLKPAFEPVILAMNPLDGTFANNALKHGVAGLNIDGCRVGTERPPTSPHSFTALRRMEGRTDLQEPIPDLETNKGRFPANFIHDGSQQVMELFPNSKSTGGQASLGAFRNGDVYGKGKDIRESKDPGYGDSGSAARYFQVCKVVDNDDFLMYNIGEGGASICGNITGNQKVDTIIIGVIKEVGQYTVAVEHLWCGNKLTEKFREDTVSIIRTLIKQMTELETLNVCFANSTSIFMEESEKTIKLLKVLNTESARSAENTSLLIAFKNGVLALIRDIAKTVAGKNLGNGETQIGINTMPTTENTVSRIKYCAKSSKRERGEFNDHATVKPLALMEYLCQLVKMPEYNLIIDPFMGSGTTLLACIKLGIPVIGIDDSESSCEIATKRCSRGVK